MDATAPGVTPPFLHHRPRDMTPYITLHSVYVGMYGTDRILRRISPRDACEPLGGRPLSQMRWQPLLVPALICPFRGIAALFPQASPRGECPHSHRVLLHCLVLTGRRLAFGGRSTTHSD